MTKQVQVITNCTCASCEKQYEQTKISHHQKHGNGKSNDVPELISLMMETHNTRTNGKNQEAIDEDSGIEDESEADDEKEEKDAQLTTTEGGSAEKEIVDEVISNIGVTVHKCINNR